MKEVILADGAIDYGNGVIGPSLSDIKLSNTPKLEEENIVGVVESADNNSHLSVSFGDYIPKGVKSWLGKNKLAKSGALALAAGALAFGGCKDDPGVENTSKLPVLRYSQALPFAPYEDWWFTGGPHSDGLSDGVRYAIDLTPAEKPISCGEGEKKVYRDKYVRATADGYVKLVGGESRADENHSVVEIDVGGSIDVGYMHLDEILVKEGQWIEQEGPIGFVSCESPPGGRTEGLHLHLYYKKNNKPLNIDTVSLSNWIVKPSVGNYEGLMERGEDVRIADTRRCGPDLESASRCGFRNDISWKKPGVDIQTPKVERTSTPKPNPTPTPHSEGVLVLGGNGDSVVVPHHEILNISGDMTIEARVKMSHESIDGYDAILAKGTNHEIYAFWASFWHCENNAPAILLDNRNDYCAKKPIPANEWVDLAMSRIGRRAIIVMNGEIILNVETDPVEVGNLDPLHIGRSPTPGDEDCVCEIDYVRIFNHGRTLEQINSDFIDFDITDEAGLVGNWEFDGNFNDTSTYGNHGVPTNKAYIR